MMVFCQILPAYRVELMQSFASGRKQSLTILETALSNRSVVIILLFAGQIISGFGQAMVWVAQGDYVAFYGSEKTKGIFFAMFWSLYMSSLIFGDVLGALLITQASGIFFYVIMGSIILVSMVFFLKMEYPSKKTSTASLDDYFLSESASYMEAPSTHDDESIIIE